jgi:hypothetical protein
VTPTPTPRFGFRVLGSATTRRRLIDFGAAFAACAGCNPTAEVGREAYLSAFAYGDAFRQHLLESGSTKGYDGPCWGPYIWWDIDREDNLDAALLDARRLAASILHRYPTLDDDDLLLFFSGSKGAHVGLPLSWHAEPSVSFHRTTRWFAQGLATSAGASIDAGVYDKVRLFRAPNSRHPKTGLHKRRLTLDELMHFDAARVRQLAAAPEPFALPVSAAADPQAAADWQAALQAVEKEAEGNARRQQAVDDGAPRLNRLTLDFIRQGASPGDRHRLLFSAAANLREFGCPQALAHALLADAALDSGLPPAEVRRQIDCGLRHTGPIPLAISSTVAPSPAASTPALQEQLAALWKTLPPTSGPYGAEGGRR